MTEAPFLHVPVLAREVLTHLTFPAGRPVRLIDGTVGGGGHSAMFLERYPQLELLGIDRDEDALAAAEQKLAFAGSRAALARGCYADLPQIAAAHGWDHADGILLDVGVSSPQLDRADRGFSWRMDGPLDMRMDRRSSCTAGRLLNRSSEAELCRIFQEYGEFKGAKKLASEIVRRRGETPFGTTADLVRVCDDVLGRAKPGKLPHPTLVFQALRIAVNDELGQLECGLSASLEFLAPRGRMAVISFHSLEDRMVKNFFRRESTGCICPPGLPVCRCGHRARLALVTRHAVTASEEELQNNRRAACAKLRVAERLQEP